MLLTLKVNRPLETWSGQMTFNPSDAIWLLRRARLKHNLRAKA